MKGRKPNPHGFLVVKATEGTPAQENRGKIRGRGRPSGRPRCPDWFSSEQRDEFSFVCRLLEDQGLLAVSDQGDVASLALARDKLRETTEFLNARGSYFWVTVDGRPYRCPVCKGRAGLEEGVNCKGCKNQGLVRSRTRQERHKYPEVIEQRSAQDLIAKLSAALGLDPTSRVRLKGRSDGKAAKSGLGTYLQNGQAVRK